MKLPHGLLGAALPTFALAASLSAQQQTILLRIGDSIPGYGTINSIYGAGMAEDGTWYVRVNTLDGSTFRPSLVLRDGAVMLEPGQSLENGPAIFERCDTIATDSLGNAIMIAEIEWPGGYQSLPSLLRNQGVVLRADTPMGVPGMASGGIYDFITNVRSIRPNQFLVKAALDVPVTNPHYAWGLVELTTDDSGIVFSEELIYMGGTLFPGTTRRIIDLPFGAHQFAGNSSGDVIAQIRMGDDNFNYTEVIALNDELLIDESVPSPVPGYAWRAHWDRSVDINEARDWVAHAILDNGSEEISCIVKNGRVLYQDGQVLDDIAPHALNGYYPGPYLRLTDEGDVLWFGSWGDGGFEQSGLFFNESLVLRRGSVLAGETVRSLGSMGLSSDGSRLGTVVYVHSATSSGVEARFVETRFDIAETFCDAAPSSLGRVANTAVMGSPTVTENDITLRATNLPDNAYVHFFTSPVQTFVPNAGGSQGNLCLGGAVGRYAGPGQILQAGPSGRVELPVDLLQHPTPWGSISVRAGETWLFQAWYRDQDQGQPVSNFTDAASVTFE